MEKSDLYVFIGDCITKGYVDENAWKAIAKKRDLFLDKASKTETLAWLQKTCKKTLKKPL